MKKFIIPAVATVLLVGGVAVVAITNEQALATVNGVKITKEEVNEHLAQIPADLLSQNEVEIRKNILERLIEQNLILQEAKKEGIYDKPEFKNQLEMITNNLAYQFTLNDVIEKELTKDVLMEQYKKILPSLKHPIVHARHILLKDEAAAKAVIKELDAGKDFVELAKAKSTGPSASNGGDLGFFKQDQMVKPFSDAAFSMEIGSYSKEPVKTQFGYHVIKVEEKKWSKEPTFEEIEAQLKQQMSQGIVQKYIEELRKEAKIEYKG